MKIQLLYDGQADVDEQPFEWPCQVSDDEPLAEYEISRGIGLLEVGESFEVGDGYSFKRVE